MTDGAVGDWLLLDWKHAGPAARWEADKFKLWESKVCDCSVIVIDRDRFAVRAEGCRLPHVGLGLAVRQVPK